MELSCDAVGQARDLIRFSPRDVTMSPNRQVYKMGGKSSHRVGYRLLLTLSSTRGGCSPAARSWPRSGTWTRLFVNDNTLTVYIKRLREKLEDDPQNPALIKTVRGLGYKAGG